MSDYHFDNAKECTLAVHILPMMRDDARNDTLKQTSSDYYAETFKQGILDESPLSAQAKEFIEMMYLDVLQDPDAEIWLTADRQKDRSFPVKAVFRKGPAPYQEHVDLATRPSVFDKD